MNSYLNFTNQLNIRYFLSGERVYPSAESISVTKLPFDTFIACESGSFTINYQSKFITCNSQEACFVPVDTEYTLNISGDSKLVFVSSGLFAYTNLRILSFFDLPNKIDGQSGIEITKACSEIAHYAGEINFTSLQIEYSVKIHECLSKLFSIVLDKSVPNGDVFDILEFYEKYSPVFEYIYKHLSENIRQEDLYTLVGMQQDPFYRSFKNLTKLAPQEYIIIEKLKVARELLVMSDMSIKEISDYVGYSDQNNFSTFFKKKYLSSPSYYRKETSRII